MYIYINLVGSSCTLFDTGTIRPSLKPRDSDEMMLKSEVDIIHVYHHVYVVMCISPCISSANESFGRDLP